MASVSAPASMDLSMLQGDDEHQVAEQAVDDGWDAREGLCRKADDLDELIAAAWRTPPGRWQHRCRTGRTMQQRQHDHEERIDDSGRHGAVVRRIMPGKQARLQVRHAHDEDIGQQRDENGEGDHGRGRDGDAPGQAPSDGGGRTRGSCARRSVSNVPFFSCCVSLSFHGGEAQIDEQDEHEQHHAAGDEGLAVQVRGVAHLQHDIGRQGAHATEQALGQDRLACPRSSRRPWSRRWRGRRRG